MDSQLLPEQIKLPCSKLLRWPTEMLWPVVDLLRLLVLHPQGSTFVAEHALKDGDEFNCVDVVSSFLLDEPSKELAMMCWRFVCNIFATPALQPSGIQIIDQIASIAQLFIADPNQAVRSHVAAALLNSAVAALATRAGNDTKTAIVEACVCLLKQEQDAANVDRLVAALGTATYGAEHLLQKHIESLRQIALVAKGTSQATQEFVKFAKL
jgi:phospholipase A-2-activating protein